jgi:hypothetical protein
MRRNIRLVELALGACLIALLGVAACTKEHAGSGTIGTSGSVLRVTDVSLGRTLQPDKSIGDRTDTFRPQDTIYASIATEGSAPSTTVTTRWTYQDGQLVDESTQTIASAGDARTEFHISKPDGWPVGAYKLYVLLNGTEARVSDFQVKR